MVRADNEKMLGANLPLDFVESFWAEAIPQKTKATKTEVVVAMANAWMELPDSIKGYYLNPGQKHESLRKFIEEIVENKLSRHFGSKAPRKVKKDKKAQIRETLRTLGEMVEVEKQQPGIIYQILDSDEQCILNEFRKLMAPPEQKRKRRKSKSA